MKIPAEILDKYVEIKIHLSSKLEKLEPQGTSPSNSADTKGSNRDLATTELPKISLMMFDGNRTRWVDFLETYKVLMHEATDIVAVKKMHYLKGCLKGEAAGVINAILITPDGYFAAWKALLQFYDNPRRMMQVYMKRYFDLPSIVNATQQNIDAVLNAKTQLHRALKNMADPAILVEYLITYSTTRPLDNDTRQRWEDSRKQQGNLYVRRVTGILEESSYSYISWALRKNSSGKIKPRQRKASRTLVRSLRQRHWHQQDVLVLSM